MTINETPSLNASIGPRLPLTKFTGVPKECTDKPVESIESNLTSVTTVDTITDEPDAPTNPIDIDTTESTLPFHLLPIREDSDESYDEVKTYLDTFTGHDLLPTSLQGVYINVTGTKVYYTQRKMGKRRLTSLKIYDSARTGKYIVSPYGKSKNPFYLCELIGSALTNIPFGKHEEFNISYYHIFDKCRKANDFSETKIKFKYHTVRKEKKNKWLFEDGIYRYVNMNLETIKMTELKKQWER